MAYQSPLRSPELDRLFEAVLSLRDQEECYRFFADLCTVGELRAMGQRLRVAELLADGLTYEEIERRTGMSPATIARVNRFLQYGNDGYRRVIARLRAGRVRDGDADDGPRDDRGEG
ncbi:MAG: YerC/YecD family TrpR-related protein [Bacillota bacterium]|nr:YerC/YecD family TrpR-related protein [Bacillota bacterium]